MKKNDVFLSLHGLTLWPYDKNLLNQQLPVSRANTTGKVKLNKDGKDHVYSGVILSTILQKAGVTSGKDLRGKNLAKYILITANDGYKVIFALAELDKDFTDKIVILADKADGKPLPVGDGPFRVIVQDEKKPARCIKQVTEIKVQIAQ